ncbi:MAG: HNH endonuclease [Nitrososphaeraceae archaeon]
MIYLTEGFDQKQLRNLLASCHRRCCICHRFCGIKIEIDHIKPSSEGGDENIENAIPLCFECHAELHLYNDNYPLGRKYRYDELKLHKEQWLEVCKNKPNETFQEMSRSDSGPLSSLLSELEYNHIICGIPILYASKEFQNTISNGILSFVNENLKEEIMITYGLINLVNIKMNKLHNTNPSLHFPYQTLEKEVLEEQRTADENISNCIISIKSFLNEN